MLFKYLDDFTEHCLVHVAIVPVWLCAWLLGCSQYMYIVFCCTCSNWRTCFLVVSFVQLPRNVLSCRRHCQLQLATQFFHGHMFTIVMAMAINLQKLCIAGLHTSWANLILGFTFCVLSHILREISKAFETKFRMKTLGSRVSDHTV